MMMMMMVTQSSFPVWTVVFFSLGLLVCIGLKTFEWTESMVESMKINGVNEFDIWSL